MSKEWFAKIVLVIALAVYGICLLSLKLPDKIFLVLWLPVIGLTVLEIMIVEYLYGNKEKKKIVGRGK